MSQPLTVGVEEEFFLVDPDSGAVLPAAAAVMAAVPSGGSVQFLQPEASTALIEVVTEPHRDLSRLANEVRWLRSAAAAAAEKVGCAVLPCGTKPVAGPYPPPTDGLRFREIFRRYGAFVFGHMPCGLHVHVGVPDREYAVRVCNHLRGWLPTLQALAGNSPLSFGEDTGFSSWRSMWWKYLPVAGPTPVLAGAEPYDALLDSLVTSGVILDRKMANWFARPSEHVPTVEVRVMDVSPSSDTTVLMAGLVRALVATCLQEVEHDTPPPSIDDQLLAAAHWQAAREGLEGHGVDVFSVQPVPAWALVDRLVAHVTPALSEVGDLPQVTDLLADMHKQGSWASRQRKMFEQSGDAAKVSAHLRSFLLA